MGHLDFTMLLQGVMCQAEAARPQLVSCMHAFRLIPALHPPGLSRTANQSQPGFIQPTTPRDFLPPHIRKPTTNQPTNQQPTTTTMLTVNNNNNTQTEQQQQQSEPTITPFSNQFRNFLTAELMQGVTSDTLSTTNEHTNQVNPIDSSFEIRLAERLRRFDEQMDQFNNYFTNTSSDNSTPPEFHFYPEDDQTTVPRIPIPPNYWARPSSSSHRAETPSRNLPSDQSQTSRERTNEFREHSIQRRSNHRPLPSLSNADNSSLSEALRGWDENRKRKNQDSRSALHPHDSLGNRPPNSSQPTTAELAEAAARESNARRSLPAFYSPDDGHLKVRTVVIPIDTNPMERRKIIVDFSKDGSIRWKDSEQKTIYERSKDGLVGEEIGEIEFDYLCLPKKPLRKPCSNLHSNNRSNNNSAARDSSITIPLNETDSRAIRAALNVINEARQREPRTIRVHHDLQPRHFDQSGSRSTDRPGFRVIVARSNSTRPSSARDTGSDSSTQTVRPQDHPGQETPARAGRASRSTSSSVGRLTRRPIRWIERPTTRDLLGPAPLRASNPDPSLSEPLPPASSYSSYIRTHSSSSGFGSHHTDADQELFAGDVDSFYQQLYNPNHPLDQFLFSSTIHRSRP
ncbi:hypothetical protein PGT21_035639 [Puccinia graminis f. sp. tritici]|uniref:Uncharacterized protein n=2 Tax=Puccinia graminis f. sp. tritici TaxID=56615 RepID=A0A5B0N032_PUCGR|nr:hypothetical protein PGT21_035639 [Puccinia graminis f. sp. tritici]